MIFGNLGLSNFRRKDFKNMDIDSSCTKTKLLIEMLEEIELVLKRMESLYPD